MPPLFKMPKMPKVDIVEESLPVEKLLSSLKYHYICPLFFWRKSRHSKKKLHLLQNELIAARVQS